MTTESSVNTINGATLLALTETMDETNQNGPESLLRWLVEYVEEAQQCTQAEACEYIAQRGPEWNGGCEGGIGVRVREDEDGNRRVQWSGRSDAYCWCELRDVLQAIADGNKPPEWFEEEWVEVWHYDHRYAYGGYWGEREGV